MRVKVLILLRLLVPIKLLVVLSRYKLTTIYQLKLTMDGQLDKTLHLLETIQVALFLFFCDHLLTKIETKVFTTSSLLHPAAKWTLTQNSVCPRCAGHRRPNNLCMVTKLNISSKSYLILVLICLLVQRWVDLITCPRFFVVVDKMSTIVTPSASSYSETWYLQLLACFY